MRILTPVLLAAMSLASYGCAQTAAAQPPAAPAPAAAPAKVDPPVPALTVTERTAIASIGEKLEAIDKQQQDLGQQRQQLFVTLHQVEAEFSAGHIGFHFEESTGHVVKDAPPTPPASPLAPAAAKK